MRRGQVTGHIGDVRSARAVHLAGDQVLLGTQSSEQVGIGDPDPHQRGLRVQPLRATPWLHNRFGTPRCRPAGRPRGSGGPHQIRVGHQMTSSPTGGMIGGRCLGLAAGWRGHRLGA